MVVIHYASSSMPPTPSTPSTSDQTRGFFSQMRSQAMHLAGPCASALCLVHCFGVAIASFFFPGVIELLGMPHEAEVGVIGLSWGLGLWMLRRSAAPRRFFVWLSLVGAGGIAAAVLHWHPGVHASLFLLAGLQLLFLFQMHRKKQAPPCCDAH